jgi:hypothetical protein
VFGTTLAAISFVCVTALGRYRARTPLLEAARA